MSTPGSNPHKKGEHVFNDIAGSVGNAFDAALSLNRANSLMLTGPHGPLRLWDLPSTSAALDCLRRDVILAEARTVVSPATGAVSDANSRLYSDARLHLERVLSELVVSTAAMIWRRKPRRNSSFHEFESIVSSMRDTRLLAETGKSALARLVNAAHDAEGERAALAERISDTELARRKKLISRMHQHRVALKNLGSTLIDTFARELESVLERRIGAA